ncbi:hypothetical protein LVD15_23010 [Fulvivirga maritima]|uniref:hypothetical protein n=1 Tax=Fulvivirga maritima TaxID=2904247 RepID=UPI001F2C6C1C|nr:hypothetical protein [Fulvivirga maritima]UII26140.1 hypothetical protein LVD15_23010 [Fulvivirga maritima]
MRKIKYLLFISICFALTNCSEKHDYPLDKRYWTLEDYNKVVLDLNYGYEEDEKLPTLDDPDTRIIVEKLTDEGNFKVILDDEELGLKHRNEVGEKFFNQWRDMADIYDQLDRKDHYMYEEEMLAVYQFGLGLQLRYFNLGNELILETADDPSSAEVKNSLKTNVGSLVNNYTIYLSLINYENAFTKEGLDKLAEGIDIYFPELIEAHPNANYKGMHQKAELMLEKSASDRVKRSLKKLISLTS